ncbi:VCBS repeat-containing protein [Spirosoma sp. BT702]|uniref:VCBS repeat-containing protein n=1 Tax=Spirosoma profusum TaxID=2771354 RepID=A0A927AWS8_9BACT|nr:FG-GAP-like repeat-containing protein [Spirosoma profusum]MBD2705883.1 VCBS repeat-containing protein [Spirosoma profusum]
MKTNLLVRFLFVVGLWVLNQANSWAQCFQDMSGSPFALDSGPLSLTIGDFNGDGKHDLVTANGNNYVSVLLNNGMGGFGAVTKFTTGNSPSAVAVGDFNNDGKQDLVTANWDDDFTVSLLLGNGTGGFGAKTDFPVGDYPHSVATGDFNADGKLDLVTANGVGNVSVLLGNGAGSFGATVNFSAGSEPYSVAVGDLNGDGKLDLVVANLTGRNVSVLLGDGAGRFSGPTNFPAGNGPAGVGIGDFNGDSKLDLAIANEGSDDVSVLLGNGAGSFGSPTNFPAGIGPYSIVVADFNGDGELDLATGNSFGHNVSVLLGNGAGEFGGPSNFPTQLTPYNVAVGDFNSDGKLDLAAANLLDHSISVLINCPFTLSAAASPNPVCAGTTVALSVTAAGGTAPYSYTWAAPPGITLSATSTSAVSASVGAALSGLQTFTVTSTFIGGTRIATTLLSVTVNAPPSLSINPSTGTPAGTTLTCANPGVSLSAVGSGMYHWNTQATTQAISVTSASTYSVTLTGTNGCTAVASILVSQEPAPSVNVVNSQTVCAGSTVAPITFSGTANTYTWTNSNPAIGLAASGTGTISSFTATNSGPTTQTALITVTPQSVATSLYLAASNTTSGQPGSVQVYDPVSNAILSTIPVGINPQNAAVSPDGSRVYVTNNDSRTVSVINPANNAVLATINTGTFSPVGIAVSPDGSKVYLTDGNSRVDVINAATNTLSTTLTGFNGALGVAISPDGSRVYIANNNTNRVSVLDATTNTISTTIGVGTNPRALVVSPDGSRVYVANFGSNRVSVIDATTNTISATIAAGGGPQGIAISPDGSRLYVANYTVGNVRVINTATNTILTTVSVDANPVGIQVSPDGRKIYVVNTGSQTVSIIDAATLSVATSATFPSGFNLAVNNGSFIRQVSCSGTPVSFKITVTPAGTATLVASNTMLTCANPTATLTATPAAPGTTYQFSGPGIVTTSPTSNTALVNEGGIYSVTVNTTSGCSSTRSLTLSESKTTPTVSITPASATLTCSSPSVSLSAIGSGNFRWITGATTPTISVTSAGPYSVTLTGTNGCTNTASISVSANQAPPSVSINSSIGTPTGTTLTCANPVASLSAIGTGTYRWSTGDTTPTISVSIADTYSVTLTSTNGCSRTASASVSADQTQPSLTLSPLSATLTCTTPAVSLSAIGNGTLRWNTGATTSVISATSADTYSVTLTGANGCSRTASSNVSVDQTPPSVSINPSIGTPTGATLTCANPGVSLSAVGSGMYHWNTQATTQAISVTSASTCSVTLTGTNGCTSVASILVSEDQTPPSVSIQPASATLSCTTPTVGLSAVGSGTYRWSTGVTTSSISVSVADTYSLTLTGANGCTATASASVIYQNCAPTVTNAVPPQSATIGDAFSYTIPANTFADAETPNSLTLAVSGLPAGLSFVSPNTITGTPSTTVGSPFNVTVVATDPGGLSASTSFSLTVHPRSFAITGVTMLDCNHISYYERRINFTVSFEATNSQPISLSVVNEISTITINEPYQLNLFTDNPVIVFKARQQGTPGEASFAYNWLAFCVNGNPRVKNAIPPQSATVGQAFSYTIPANTFTDAETPNSLSLSVVGLPSGLSFVAPRTITGSVSATANSFYSVTVTATDASGGSISTVLPLSVVNPTGCANMYSVKDGDWSDASMWSCGRVPLLTDIVTLNHAVSLPASYQAQAMRVIYSPGSRLVLGNTSRLRLGGN